MVCKSSEYAFAKEGVVSHLAFRVDVVNGMLNRLRAHGVQLAHEQPAFVEKLSVTSAFFWGLDGEKLELGKPSASV